MANDLLEKKFKLKKKRDEPTWMHETRTSTIQVDGEVLFVTPLMHSFHVSSRVFNLHVTRPGSEK
jgi:hypothetical protein